MGIDVSPSVAKVLSSHLDEDNVEYITSLLEEAELNDGGNDFDDDAREAVEALICGSVEDTETSEELIVRLWEELRLSLGGGGDNSGAENNKKSSSSGGDDNDDDAGPTTKKLNKAITLKDKDEVTYASGLRAETDSDGVDVGASAIQSFYANMIGIQSKEIMSEKARRKAAQKALKEKKAEEDRLQAIRDAMERLTNPADNDDDATSTTTTSATDGAYDENDDGHGHAADVHFRGFSLPNKKGSGADLLTDTNLTLAKGRRYGLMGRNGCGKTTLMELISKRGIKGIPSKMSMLLVRQEIVGNELTPVQCVLRSDPRVEALKMFIKMAEQQPQQGGGGPSAATDKQTTNTTTTKKQKESKNKRQQKQKKQQSKNNASAAATAASSSNSIDATRLARAYERLQQIEEEEGPPEPRARKILHGMGFSEEMQEKPTKELSGGWRMRVSLCNALFACPDLLLLDEPTNHLDLEAVLWLEKYLSTKHKGTVLVVSHDRHFLNEIVTDVVHFYNGKLTTYRGDITNYESVVEENKKRQIRQRENQEAQREHLQKYIDLHAKAHENGVKASKQRKSRMKKLEKLGTMAAGEGKRYKASYDGVAEEIEEYKEDDTVVLNFPDPGSFDGNIITMDQASFGYDNGRLLLQDIDLTISMHSRAALLGRNGCGKSTLIKLMVGALNPLKGNVSIDRRAKIEYLAQHQLEQLDPESTPMETLLEKYPGDQSNNHKLVLRRYLANFGLGGETLPLQKIHTMSGGQKCRLCLACAMYRKPHLLILDEPTNHLDLETTQALIESIRTFQGGVLLVSHDQHLLTSVCKDLYVVGEGGKGKVERLRHGVASDAFNAYKKAVIQGRR